MTKPVSIQRYLRSIKDLVLPEPHSEVTREFVKYVIEAHSWYKGQAVQDPSINMLAFNFFVGPGSLIEAKGGMNERAYDQFQYLKYFTNNIGDAKDTIPRQIYDAGLVIVPGCATLEEGYYNSKQSQRIMVTQLANMLEAVNHYRKRYKH